MNDLCQILYKKPMTVTQLFEETGLSKNTIYYKLKTLIQKEYVEVISDKYRNKLYGVTPKCPMYSLAPKTNIKVYLNLKRKGSDYAWQRKKHRAGSGIGTMQSSMALFDIA